MSASGGNVDTLYEATRLMSCRSTFQCEVSLVKMKGETVGRRVMLPHCTHSLLPHNHVFLSPLLSLSITPFSGSLKLIIHTLGKYSYFAILRSGFNIT